MFTPRIILSAIFFGVLSHASSLSAATFTVTNTNDSGAGSLRQAVADAKAAAGDDLIVFDLPANVERVIRVTSSDIVINSNLMIINDRPGDVPVTIKGELPSHILGANFYLLNKVRVVISGLTITAPNADAGIRNQGGDLALRNCLLTGNNGYFLGGAITSSSGQLTLTHCTLTGNKAKTGGAIYAENTEVSLMDSVLADNEAENGGAISTTSHVTLIRCDVSGNKATSSLSDRGNGGALSGGHFSLMETTFSNNVASNSGGAIYNLGVLTLRNCTFIQNHAFFGGAIYDYGTTVERGRGLKHTLIEDSTFAANFAEPKGFASLPAGGAIYANYRYINSGHPGMRVNNCTFAGNYVAPTTDGNGKPFFPDGGAITAAGAGIPPTLTEVILSNSIFENGNSGRSLFALNGGAFTSLGHNLSADDAAGDTGTGPGGRLNGPGDIRNTSPQLGPLADNGGSTKTFALLDGSPALDAADGALAIPRDQRGFARNQTADIGSFELGGRIPENRLANISTRFSTSGGENQLIAGFIITGAQSKRVMLRGIGPSLSGLATLKDPTLRLYDSSGQLLISNDNWGDANNRQEIVDSTIAPKHALESAILATLAPGAYTAIIAGKNGSSGIAVAEAYDLDGNTPSKLANISSRGFVSSGGSVMIGGFIVTGPDSASVVIRALGPSLPVTTPLPDPSLELFDANGSRVAENDDWGFYEGEAAEIRRTGIHPPEVSESAIVAMLAPGAYTALVREIDQSPGIAVVEVYSLE